MFFIRYLGRELRRRMRSAIVIALGLALGIGLVITVIAASTGVKNAQASVLRSLYGVGTDVTVTKTPPAPSAKGGPANGQRFSISVGPNGAEVCHNGVCKKGAQTISTLFSPGQAALPYSSVSAISKLHDVSAVAGGLTLTDNKITIPGSAGPSTSFNAPTSFTVQGVDLARPNLGPLSAGTIKSGHNFAASDTNSNVAVVDANYAISNKLKVGSTVTVAKTKFKIIGIVTQAQGSNPPQVYIPLARAQALATNGPGGKHMTGAVNTIYVTAASAADISMVQKEIKKLMPTAKVTTASSLASQITGGLASAARLAGDLGKWLSILVLFAAVAIASLLTMAAVSRRVREFGTLKALGWRSKRIIAQVMGESVSTGVIGGLLGIGLGVAGIAIINAIAPNLTATVTQASGLRFFGQGPGGPVSSAPNASHTVSVPWSATVTAGVIGLAVVLAIVGGLLAGAFGSWRISQLRPAQALARVD